MVYLDESGFESTTNYRPYGRAKQGKRLISDISGKRAKRTSVISGLRNGKLIAPGYFEGYTDSKLFNAWLEKSLLPELEPGQVVIMDNAAFHKNPKTRELIESAKCRLIYLPTYSPDLNPIEKVWANIKARIRKNRKLFNNIENALIHELKSAQLLP